MKRTSGLFFILLILAAAAAGMPPLAQSGSPSAIPALAPGRDFVTVSADGGAGGYEAFPDVCRLADGRLMAVFYAGYGHVSLPSAAWPKGGRIVAVHSGDEGRTWSRPKTVFDGPDDDRDPSIVQLPSGRLLCNFFSLKADAAAANGWRGLGTRLVASDDGGATWSEPRTISSDYYCSSPIRLLPGGGLMLGLYKEESGKSWGAVVRSEDGGRTWGPVIDIPNGGWKLDAETDVLALSDGSLLAVEREPSVSLCSSTSKDGGRTWSVSKPLGFPGHCPYLLRTKEGAIVLAHRLPQTSLHVSWDEGRHWSTNVLVDDVGGAYPSMVELRDGSILIVYYEEGAGSNIRARRFRVVPSGVEWLTLGAAGAGASLSDAGSGFAVRVTREGRLWRIQGRRVGLVVDPDSLALTAKTPAATWATLPSSEGDLTLGTPAGKDIGRFRLSGAARKSSAPYVTGTLTGVAISLAGFRPPAGEEIDARLELFIGLEGVDEDLVCRIRADDGAAPVRELLWPASVEPGSFEASVVPFMQGMLLPKTWPRRVALYESLTYGRGLYMPWWGYQQGRSAALVLLETPADAGVRFGHPAGGPTRLDVRWVHSLGRWAYPREVRMCFLDEGSYVDLAKRYRRHAVESGTFVSLREKIARNPLVGKLIGAPVVHTSILYHVQPASSYYDKKDPAKNHQLVTFDARIGELRALAAKGIGRAYVHLDGWGLRGYDNLHPDVLPPCPEAGGWEGMKRFADALEALGFVFAVHDQYRDYYLDGPTYNPRQGVLREDGGRSFDSTWYGGVQTFLCSSQAPAYVKRNQAGILARGVKLRGAYLDVFSVVPGDECYDPEHPVTRAQSLAFRGACFDYVRSWGGVVSSEEPCDWAVPYLDLVHHGPFALDPNPGAGPAMGVPIPLFDLVYHDAILLPWSLGKGAWGIPESDLGFLHGLGHAGLPYLSLAPSEEELRQVRTMCALNARVGLLELTRHEFLDEARRRQRFTYADGTTVTVDFEAGTFAIAPDLPVPGAIRRP